jgi:hypothetical protein
MSKTKSNKYKVHTNKYESAELKTEDYKSNKKSQRAHRSTPQHF